MTGLSVLANHHRPWAAADVWGLYEAEDCPDGIRFEGVAVEVGKDLLVPDLVVVPRPVLSSRRKELSPQDVVVAVEVESPTGLRRDRLLKNNAYAEAGIPNYWRVEMTDPARPVVVMSRLQDGVYLPGEPQEFPIGIAPGELGA